MRWVFLLMTKKLQTHMRISWILYQKDGISSYPPPSPPSDFSPDSPIQTSPKISPSLIFLIIVILAALFFISGIIHLLVRILTRKRPARNLDTSSQNALQLQLQQLFHLNDSGLEQSLIDTLPIFTYREILGNGHHELFDCPVCLCGFSESDRLRLLPACSHAFHVDCVDTWLLTNSTCPLCRGMVFDPCEDGLIDFSDFMEEIGSGSAKKSVEVDEVGVERGVFAVRLGKFRKMDGGGDEETGDGIGSSDLAVDIARRCFSMGSYEYVVSDGDLSVALRREGDSCEEGKRICVGPRNDSYSVSKIWQWPRRGDLGGPSGEARLGEGLSSGNSNLAWMHRRGGKFDASVCFCLCTQDNNSCH